MPKVWNIGCRFPDNDSPCPAQIQPGSGQVPCPKATRFFTSREYQTDSPRRAGFAKCHYCCTNHCCHSAFHITRTAPENFSIPDSPCKRVVRPWVFPHRDGIKMSGEHQCRDFMCDPFFSNQAQASRRQQVVPDLKTIPC